MCRAFAGNVDAIVSTLPHDARDSRTHHASVKRDLTNGMITPGKVMQRNQP